MVESRPIVSRSVMAPFRLTLPFLFAATLFLVLTPHLLQYVTSACAPTSVPTCPWNDAQLARLPSKPVFWTLNFAAHDATYAQSAPVLARRVVPSNWTNLPSSSTVIIHPSEYFNLLLSGDTGVSNPSPTLNNLFTLSIHVRFLSWAPTANSPVILFQGAANAWQISQTTANSGSGFTWTMAVGGSCPFTTPFQLNRWHHIAVTVQSGVASNLYLDGEPINTCAIPAISSLPLTESYLNAKAGAIASGLHFEIATFDFFQPYVLSPAEIYTLYSILPPNVGYREDYIASAVFSHTFPSNKLQGQLCLLRCD